MASILVARSIIQSRVTRHTGIWIVAAIHSLLTTAATYLLAKHSLHRDMLD